MRVYFTIIYLLFFLQAGAQVSSSLADEVNPLMGTLSKPALSNGNTYPAIALPWGMNIWTPQTGEMGNGWQYTYDADKINGFKQTHQPSPWMGDYGQFAIMPVTGRLKVNQKDRASWFSHKTEVATPYAYSVYLADYDVTAELTPTERSAQFRFTFPKSDSSFVVIDALDDGSSINVIPGQNKITGYSTKHANGPLKNFKNYFVIYCDKPFTISRAYSNGVEAQSLSIQAKHAIGAIGFKTKAGEKVHLHVASSFISLEQAELNLRREQGNASFDDLKQKALNIWNQTLGSIQVDGGTTGQRQTFYSCLYRMLFFPQKLYEVDANNKIVHWSPHTGSVHQGYFLAEQVFGIHSGHYILF